MGTHLSLAGVWTRRAPTAVSDLALRMVRKVCSQAWLQLGEKARRRSPGIRKGSYTCSRGRSCSWAQLLRAQRLCRSLWLPRCPSAGLGATVPGCLLGWCPPEARWQAGCVRGAWGSDRGDHGDHVRPGAAEVQDGCSLSPPCPQPTVEYRFVFPAEGCWGPGLRRLCRQCDPPPQVEGTKIAALKYYARPGFYGDLSKCSRGATCVVTAKVTWCPAERRLRLAAVTVPRIPARALRACVSHQPNFCCPEEVGSLDR